MKKQNFFSFIAKMLLFGALFLFFYTPSSYAKAAEIAEEIILLQDESAFPGDVDRGKELFNANCAACHKRYKRSTGPELHGMTNHLDIQWIYDWVHNSTAMINAGDAYAVKIYEEYNRTAMTHFPQLSEADIDDIIAYVEQPMPEPAAVASSDGASGAAGGGGGLSSNLVLGILAFVLLLLVVILTMVNKTLTRFAKEKGIPIHDGGEREKFKPFWKAVIENQFVMIVASVVFLLFASYWMYFYLMQIGVDQEYEPIQPIHYSHRIHAGDNQIDCKYCHSSARHSQTSGIPSLNVCMNCHMAISEVAEETATPEYSKEFYDGEIAKLYEAVGWDPDQHKYTGEGKPVKWVRIHNLPDFSYFNHAQHVEAGKIDCQTCHGPVEEMEIMRQQEKLTMGWCIDCHRTTNVKMEGNRYYEKIHEELSQKYGVEQLTEAQMGGLECGRCHY